MFKFELGLCRKRFCERLDKKVSCEGLKASGIKGDSSFLFVMSHPFVYLKITPSSANWLKNYCGWAEILQLQKWKNFSKFAYQLHNTKSNNLMAHCKLVISSKLLLKSQLWFVNRRNQIVGKYKSCIIHLPHTWLPPKHFAVHLGETCC